MDETDELVALLRTVSDEQSFLKFVEALISSRVRAVEAEKKNPRSPFGPNAGDWENTSIERFLESAVARARDTNCGLDQGLRPAIRGSSLPSSFLPESIVNDPVRTFPIISLELAFIVDSQSKKTQAFPCVLWA